MILKICRKIIKKKSNSNGNSNINLFLFIIIGIIIYVFRSKNKKKEKVKIVNKTLEDDSNKLYVSNISNNNINYSQIDKDSKKNIKFDYKESKNTKFFNSNKEKNIIANKINEKLNEEFNYENILDNKYDIDYENKFNPDKIERDSNKRNNIIDNNYVSNKLNIDDKLFINNNNVYDVNNKKIVINKLKLRNENVDMNRNKNNKDIEPHNKNRKIKLNESLDKKYKEVYELENFSGFNFIEKDDEFGLKTFDESKNINQKELFRRRTLLEEEERLEQDLFNNFKVDGLVKPVSSIKPNKVINQKELDKYKGLEIKDIYNKFVHDYKNVDIKKTFKNSNIQGEFISGNAFTNLDIKNY